MKVVQINSTCKYGSTGKIVLDIHKELSLNGYESFVLYGGKFDGKVDNTKHIINRFELKVNTFISRFLGISGFFGWLSTKRIIRELEIIKPDIIHLHNLHGYYLNIEILFKYLNKRSIKTVITFHDCWPITGHCTHFMSVNCDKWKSECFNCPLLNCYPKSYLFDTSNTLFIKKKDLLSSTKNLIIVTPSDWLKGIVLDSFLKEKQIRVINNGINLEVFHPINSDWKYLHGFSNRKIILGVSNNMTRSKGFEEFLKLSRLISKEFLIVLIGVKEAEKSQYENILMLSRTNSVDELVELYNMADVFVNLTLEDNFPTVNIEALACGTPVITYDVGGCKEIIDEKTGTVVKLGDIHGILSAIKTICSNNKEVYSRECVIRAMQKYNKDFKYKEYIQLYEKCSININ